MATTNRVVDEQLIREIGSDEVRQNAVSGIVSNLVSRDPDLAADLAARYLRDPELRRRAEEQIARQRARASGDRTP